MYMMILVQLLAHQRSADQEPQKLDSLLHECSISIWETSFHFSFDPANGERKKSIFTAKAFVIHKNHKEREERRNAPRYYK